MAWVAVDKDGAEIICEAKPEREGDAWECYFEYNFLYLPKGSIKKLIGRELSFEDEAVELREE